MSILGVAPFWFVSHKMAARRGFERQLGLLLGALEASWAGLGRSWAVLGPLRGRSLGVLTALTTLGSMSCALHRSKQIGQGPLGEGPASETLPCYKVLFPRLFCFAYKCCVA